MLWLGGSLVSEDRALISALDRGLTVGDGVFETMVVVAGQAFALTRHLVRLRRSARGLGIEIPMSDDELRSAVAATIAANHATSGRLRLTVTAGDAPLGPDRSASTATIVVAISDLPDRRRFAHVATVPWRRNEHSAVMGLKTTSYAENVVALHHAQELGADEALFANTADELCEGSGSNIFVELEGRLVTPPLSSGCLGGITRELVAESSRVTETAIPMSALDHVGEAFLTSSLRGVQPIAAIDGRALARCPGPLTVQAQQAFARICSSTLDP